MTSMQLHLFFFASSFHFLQWVVWEFLRLPLSAAIIMDNNHHDHDTSSSVFKFIYHPLHKASLHDNSYRFYRKPPSCFWDIDFKLTDCVSLVSFLSDHCVCDDWTIPLSIPAVDLRLEHLAQHLQEFLVNRMFCSEKWTGSCVRPQRFALPV